VRKKRYVAQSWQVAARRLGDETMIMSGQDSILITLNDVASAIWEAADGSTSLDEIVEQKICSKYEVSLAKALQDANALVEELAGYGILLLSEEPFRQSSRGQEAK
jgi:hypothetical protein